MPIVMTVVFSGGYFAWPSAYTKAIPALALANLGPIWWSVALCAAGIGDAVLYPDELSRERTALGVGFFSVTQGIAIASTLSDSVLFLMKDVWWAWTPTWCALVVFSVFVGWKLGVAPGIYSVLMATLLHVAVIDAIVDPTGYAILFVVGCSLFVIADSLTAVNLSEIEDPSPCACCWRSCTGPEIASIAAPPLYWAALLLNTISIIGSRRETEALCW